MLAFSATNLTKVKRAQYRYSEEEQSKLDVIGRLFYQNLTYKFWFEGSRKVQAEKRHIGRPAPVASPPWLNDIR